MSELFPFAPDPALVFACLTVVGGDVQVIWSRRPFTIRNDWVIPGDDRAAELVTWMCTRGSFERVFGWLPRWHGTARRRDWEKSRRAAASADRPQVAPSHPMLLVS